MYEVYEHSSVKCSGSFLWGLTYLSLRIILSTI